VSDIFDQVCKIYNYRYSYSKKFTYSSLWFQTKGSSSKFNDFFAITLHTNRDSTLVAR